MISTVRSAVPVIAVAVVLASGCTGSTQTDGQGDGSTRFVTMVDVADRQKLPAIEGRSIDGEALSTSDFAGRVLVVNLWGSWCAPCRAEAPVLHDVSQEYAAKDVQFLGIVNDASDEESTAFAARAGLDYPHFSDHGGALELSFRTSLPATTIPTTWVIDRDGRVAARIIDSDLARSTLGGVLDEILAEPAPAPA